jgi:hypothetical protein
LAWPARPCHRPCTAPANAGTGNPG